MVIIIRGHLPPPNKARYTSFSLVDIFPPGATVSTLTDQTLRNYYSTFGQSDPVYTILAAKNELVLARCGFDSNTLLNNNFFPWTFGTSFQAPNLAVHGFPGLVYREAFTDSYAGSLERTKYECQDVNGCDNPLFFKAEMGKYYPK